ncbi:MAG TPA: hypothetical protein PKD55_26880, partial [Bellilinea sp.]|nr:hypothetical protein [Bellilinea sp.]
EVRYSCRIIARPLTRVKKRHVAAAEICSPLLLNTSPQGNSGTEIAFCAEPALSASANKKETSKNGAIGAIRPVRVNTKMNTDKKTSRESANAKRKPIGEIQRQQGNGRGDTARVIQRK